MILAPLTRANHVPFRELTVKYGAEATMSEMAFARNLTARRPNLVELSRLRRSAAEPLYGVQVATKQIDECVRAGLLAAEAGASWLDLNCGCPIHEATRRGLGATLLRKPKKLARLVRETAAAIPIPMTVKIRTGEKEKKINVLEVVEALQDTGIAAVSIHGRTKEARYTRAARWDLIRDAVAASQVPVVGNGDVLTHYEARDKLRASGAHAVMVGRGALIKPWIFQEFKENRVMLPTTRERIGIYMELVDLMKTYFGDDARGRSKAWYFFPWHFSFLCRYRPMPEDMFLEASREHPLINSRFDVAVAGLEGHPDGRDLPPLERLLRCQYDDAHEALASILWDEGPDEGAVLAALQRAADTDLPGWDAARRGVAEEEARAERERAERRTARSGGDGEGGDSEEEEEPDALVLG
ncbi:unnamed protein product [Pedinophyceae sp. YPF-701]|nr:unnamed protein product [Pedinophyceae sp. YPF-701]